MSWSEQLTTDKFRLMPKNDRVLDIIFGEMRLREANLGVLLRGGELETLTIDADAYYQHNSRIADFLSLYIIAGVIFDTEDRCHQFLQIAEKHYLIGVLCCEYER